MCLRQLFATPSRRNVLPFLSAALVVLYAGSAWTTAQDTQNQDSFEVASIRPIQPVPPYPNFFVEANKFRANHATAALIIAAAYGVHRAQLLGGPEWIDSDRFNIDARAEGPLPAKTEAGAFREPLSGMVRRLLADRFQLRVHRETRQMSVLALVRIPRSGGNSIDRMQRAERDCSSIQSELASASAENRGALFAECFERQDVMTMSVRGAPVGRLADHLSGRLGRIVIDETGLLGNFNLVIKWEFSADRAQRDALMLTALEEQLGLKLENRRAPLPVVIIDTISRPSPN